MITCKKNRYVHEIEMDSCLCLYNSMTHDIIYLRDDKYKNLWNSMMSIEVIPDEFIDFFNKLTESDFIVPVDYNYQEKIKSIISPLQKSKHSINILYFVPTLKCNMLCKYCHIKNGSETQLDMNQNTVDKAFDKVMKYNDKSLPTEIVFYGGEPTLNFDIVKYIVEKSKGLFNERKITMFTNATIIDDNIARYIHDNNIFTIVSLDGTQNSHDKARVYCDGNGTFNDVKRGYSKLREFGCSVGVSIVVGQHNVDTLEKDVEYVLDELKPIDIGLSTLHMLSNGKNPLDVDIEYLTERMIQIFQIARNRNIYVEHLFRRIRPIVEKLTRIADCPSCGSKLLFTPSNTITFCEAYMQESQYTYDIDKFDIFQNDDYHKWASRTPFAIEDCHNCIALSTCGGGCPYDAEKRHGSINSMDKIRCVQSIILTKWCLNEIYKETLSNRDGEFLIPTIEERRKIYGGINFGNLPLRIYSQKKEYGVK